jgi:PAS domain S-box-containing protein
MINEFLQERAALYASGTMSPEEREQFQIVLEFNDDLRALTVELAEVGAAIAIAALPRGGPGPSAALKTRVLRMVRERPAQLISEGLVACGPNGLVHWVNSAFITMCGYTLEELRGKRLGPILQGEKTDRKTAERMRHAVHERRVCREVILNYRKNGEPYWVEIAIAPILDDAGQPLWLVARENELAEPIPA